MREKAPNQEHELPPQTEEGGLVDPWISPEPLIQVDPRPQEFQSFVDRNRLYVDLVSGKDVNYILLREQSPGYLRSLMATGTLEIDGNIARLPEVQRKNREEEARRLALKIPPKIEPHDGGSWLHLLKRKMRRTPNDEEIILFEKPMEKPEHERARGETE